MLCYVHDSIDQLPYDYYAIFTCQIVTSMLFNKHITTWKDKHRKKSQPCMQNRVLLAEILCRGTSIQSAGWEVAESPVRKRWRLAVHREDGIANISEDQCHLLLIKVGCPPVIQHRNQRLVAELHH